MNDSNIRSGHVDLKTKIIDPNYVFLFSKRQAYETLERLVRYPFKYMEKFGSLYDGASPTKETYVFIYKCPSLYQLAKLFKKILPDKPNEILMEYFQNEFFHEAIHQVIYENVGYRPQNEDDIDSLESILHELTNIENYKGPFPEGPLSTTGKSECELENELECECSNGLEQ